MKRFAIILALLLAAAGCDSASDHEREDTPALGTVSARINGERYEASAGTAVLDTTSGRPILSFASGASGYGLAFTLFPFEGAEHHSFVGVNAQGVLRFGVVAGAGKSYSTLRDGGSGSVDVTRVGDAEVEGTFQFTALTTGDETAEVTEGRFKVPLTRQ